MSFQEKKNLLFASLETAEQSIATDSTLHQTLNEAEYSLVRNNKPRIKSYRVERYRGKESIFKRPNASIAQCLMRSRIPDHKRNPHKWTKYTLEDVDTSERSNTAAAFSFLKQMEEQREASNVDPTEGDAVQPRSGFCKSVVRFNRSVRLRGQLEEADEPVDTPAEDRPQFNGRRVLMPEYVVGQKDPKKVKRMNQRKAPPADAEKVSGLHLDHLMEENEDEDEDEDENGNEPEDVL